MRKPDFIGSTEVGRMIGKSRKTVRRWTDLGYIPYAFITKGGGMYRYRRSAIEAWLTKIDKVTDAAERGIDHEI